MMGIGEILSLGKQVSEVMGKILDQLPSHDQRVMKEFYKFIDRYNEEIAREDSDHDDLILWRERKELLINTILKELRK